MPANLTPEYFKADKAYRQAKTHEEKIACLEHMLRVIPKHKGTDRMQGDLKRKLARLRKEGEQAGKGKKAPVFKVVKEGAGQVVLLGGPNTGKSQLVASLTNARATVAAYPFTTHIPQPGMMKFEDVQIQLVDTPPVTEDYMEAWMPDTVRRADATLLTADMGSDDFLDATDVIIKRLESMKIHLVKEPPPDDEERPEIFRRAAVVATRMDMPDADSRLAMLQELFAGRFDIWPISAAVGAGLEAFPERVFRLLRIMRVYTKEPGQKPDMAQPYTVPVGSTVIELAVKVHRDFEQSLKSARVWGSGKYDGIHVKRDHVLSDRDIIELHE